MSTLSVSNAIENVLWLEPAANKAGIFWDQRAISDSVLLLIDEGLMTRVNPFHFEFTDTGKTLVDQMLTSLEQ
jgi:hypothetical protein